MTYLAFSRDSGGFAGEIDVIDTNQLLAGVVPMVVTGESLETAEPGIETGGPPRRFACAPDGFYFAEGRWNGKIYFAPLEDLKTANLIYTHPTWVDGVRIKEDTASQKGYRVFFDAFQLPNTITPSMDIYYLKDDNAAAKYFTVDPSILILPDPCTCAEDAVYASWQGDFCFDNQDGLYLGTGNSWPGAIWRVPGAGSTEVTGNIQRIISWKESPYSGTFEFLAFEPPRQLYYTDGGEIDRFDLDSTLTTVTAKYGIFDTNPHILPYSYGPNDVGVCTLLKTQHYVTAHVYKKIGEFLHQFFLTQSYKEREKAIGRPTPHPHPERIVQAQDWAIQQLLSKKGIKASAVTPLTERSLRFKKVGTADQVSGTVADQYGKWHTYTVQIARNGDIRIEGSIVR